MNNNFKPKPIPLVLDHSEIPNCSCGTLGEYENFLIDEYGAEKVLEVRQEEESRKKMFETMSLLDKCALMVPLATLFFKEGGELK